VVEMRLCLECASDALSGRCCEPQNLGYYLPQYLECFLSGREKLARYLEVIVESLDCSWCKSRQVVLRECFRSSGNASSRLRHHS
jgi:hypothetical protein